MSKHILQSPCSYGKKSKLSWTKILESKILPRNVEVFSDIKLDNGVKYGVATECCHKLFFTKAKSSEMVLFICLPEIKNRM